MTLMELESVVVAEGPVTELVINRPEDQNVVNQDVLRAMLLALRKIERNPEVRVITLWGAGDEAFAAGMDVRGISGMGQGAIADFVELGQRVMRALENVPVPVVAAVNGYALGIGLELALASDIIVAGHTAQFGLPELGLGLVPGFGGMERLIQRCGLGTARRLVFTGAIVDSAEAVGLGLADMLAEPDMLSQVVDGVTDMIASKAPLAMTRAKELIRRSGEERLLSGLRREVEGFLSLFDSADCEEGLDAFLQKRAPRFTGR